jgi:hypothetical protein
MSEDGRGRPAAYDDLLALPEHVVGEIIDGESAAGDTKVRAEPFDPVELDLAAIWAL